MVTVKSPQVRPQLSNCQQHDQRRTYYIAPLVAVLDFMDITNPLLPLIIYFKTNYSQNKLF